MTSLGQMTDVHSKGATMGGNDRPMERNFSGRRKVGRLEEVTEGAPSLNTGCHRGLDVLHLAQYVQLIAGIQIAFDQSEGCRDHAQIAELGSGAQSIEDGVQAQRALAHRQVGGHPGMSQALAEKGSAQLLGWMPERERIGS